MKLQRHLIPFSVLCVLVFFTLVGARPTLAFQPVDAAAGVAVTTPEYTITISGPTYDYAANTTTFTYRVCSGRYSISHVTVQLAGCIGAGDVVSASPRITSWGKDPTTGISGIKWDQGVAENTCVTYTLVLRGLWQTTTGQWAIKGGKNVGVVYGTGVTVLSCKPLPTATPTNTAVPTATSTKTLEPTNTPTKTAVPTDTPTKTLEPTATPTNTAVPTDTPTKTLEPTDTPTNTAVPTTTPINTAVPTATSTKTSVPTNTPTNTAVPTATSTKTLIPTNTPLPTATPTRPITGPSEGKIGDLVWLDDNRNGTQDPGEPGVGGVTVRLFQTTGQLLGALTTDDNGHYLFEHLLAGDYWLEFQLPEGYAFTDPRQGSSDSVDSDSDPVSGMAVVLPLDTNEVDLTWDAGVYQPLGAQPGCSTCPDGVLFQSDRAGSFDIYRTNDDGSGLLRLTQDTGDNVDPTWRFSGEEIAFASNRSGDWDIYRMDAFGGGQVNVTQRPLATDGSSPSYDLAPSWACYWIAFQSNRDGNWEIYKTDPSGLLQIRLTNNAAADEAPSWSADGQWLAFQSNRDGNWELYLMDASGDHLRRLTTNAAADRNPTWSSDGQWLYFDSDRDGNRDIYKLNVQDGSIVRLTDDPAADSDPDGVPYCGVVYFESQRWANEDVYRMAEDGSNQVDIILGDGGPGYWSDQLDGLDAAILSYVPPEHSNMVVLPLVLQR